MKTWLLTAAVLVAGGLYAAWFFTTHERVVVEVPSPYRGEARVNDFFAAEMLLRKLGYEADSLPSLTPSEWLPDTGDTLLARSSTTFASDDELALLNGWVVAGGHLVLLAPALPTPESDAVFEYFGFPTIVMEPPEEIVDKGVLTPASMEETSAPTYEIAPVGVLQRFDVAESDLFRTLRDQQGVFAARRRWGYGYVTAIAASAQFDNRLLADFDHARLLLDTVAGYIEPGKVWLIYDNIDFPPLWRLIWTHAPYAVAGIAAVLVLWLWSVMPRFGPVVTAGAPVRRSIIEHVKAAGRFVWRHDGAESLVASSTAAVLRRAEATHPGIARLPAAEQAALLAEMTGQDERAVLAALAPAANLGPRELVHKIHALQTIRKKL